MSDLENALEIIRTDFEKRKRKNKSFSVRSYARFLSLSPATLSRVMSGKAVLTSKVFEQIAERIGVENSLRKQISQSLFEMKKSRSFRNLNDSGIRRLQEFEYELVSDFHHFAIIELLKIKRYNYHPQLIKEKLELKSVKEVEDSVALMRELGILTEEKGLLVANPAYASLNDDDKTSEARKKRQLQALQMSQKKLGMIDIKLRDHSTITFAMDPKLLPQLKDRIFKFRRALVGFVDKNSEDKSEVYELQVSLFPITSGDQ